MRLICIYYCTIERKDIAKLNSPANPEGIFLDASPHLGFDLGLGLSDDDANGNDEKDLDELNELHDG